MRRLRTLPVVGAVALSVVLSACGGSEEDSDKAAESAGPQASASAGPAASATASASAAPEAIVDPVTRALSTILLGSTNTEGKPAEFGASEVALSGDGNFLAYRTPAEDVIPKPADKGPTTILVRDLRSNSVVPACTSEKGEAANGDCESPTLSFDGEFVAFSSTATNLVPEDTNPNRDVFRKDLRSGAVVLVSSAAKNGTPRSSSSPSITADGRGVAFVSDGQIYLKDLAGGTETLVSRTATGKPGDADSTGPKIAADGSTVAFGSRAGNLAGKPRQGVRQVLLAKTATGKVVGLEKLLRLKLPTFNFVLDYSTPTRLGGRIAYTVGIDTLDDDEDGSTEASTSNDEGVYVADLNRARVVHTVRTATGSVDRKAGCAELSADGKQLAYCTFVKKTKAQGSGYGAYLAEVDGNMVRLLSGPPRGTKDPDARPEAISTDGGAVVFRSANPQRGADAEIAEFHHQMFVARPGE